MHSSVAAPLSPPGPKARTTDPQTSHAAAERALPTRGRTSWRILECLKHAGQPLAYDEIAQRTGIKGVTVSTRLTEIRRSGLAVALMPSPEHKAQRVKLTPAGAALLAGDSSLAHRVAA
jgi:DNA-binding MarR family transcriptional regulator